MITLRESRERVHEKPNQVGYQAEEKSVTIWFCGGQGHDLQRIIYPHFNEKSPSNLHRLFVFSNLCLNTLFPLAGKFEHPAGHTKLIEMGNMGIHGKWQVNEKPMYA